MEITWFGHSCFRLRGKDVTIVTDPFDRSLGYPPLKLSADIVTVSHQSPHHSFIQAVSGNPRVVDGPGEYEISGIFITGVAVHRDKQKTSPRTTAYLIEIEDLRVCHLGDLGHVLDSDEIELLKEPDVLFVPVGGTATLDAAQAAEVVAQLEAKCVVPMHYGTEAVAALGLAPVERFLREMGAAATAPQPRLSITHSNVPEQTTVCLLDYRR